MKLTFDHNLLIDLENETDGAGNVKELIELHDAGTITIQVSAIGASEKLRDGSYSEDFSKFQGRIRRLSTRPVELLMPPAYYGITFWEWSVWADEAGANENLELQIHEILFPEVGFEWNVHKEKKGLILSAEDPNHIREFSWWRNRKCDVLSMWCHIHYGGDVFVTRDSNFLKATKQPALINLGAKQLLTPLDALRFVKSMIDV